jgi:hypothetical protein
MCVLVLAVACDDAAEPGAPAPVESVTASAEVDDAAADTGRADVTVPVALIERRAVGDAAGWADALAAERRTVAPKLMRDGVAVTGGGAGALKSLVRPGFETTFAGNVLLMRVKRDELVAHVAEQMRALVALLPESERNGVAIEASDDGVTVRSLPRAVALSLAAQAPYARINDLFGPFRDDLKGVEVSLFAEGNSTVRARDSDGRGRERLARWLARIPRAPDVRFVLRDFCWEEGGRDIGVEVVSAPAPLTGAFVRRVFTTKDAIITEVEPRAGERMLALATAIAPSNQTAMMVWGDRVLWWTWAAVMHPESRQHWTRYDLRTRAPEQSCATPTLVEIAGRVRAAALIEEARAQQSR